MFDDQVEQAMNTINEGQEYQTRVTNGREPPKRSTTDPHSPILSNLSFALSLVRSKKSP